MDDPFTFFEFVHVVLGHIFGDLFFYVFVITPLVIVLGVEFIFQVTGTFLPDLSSGDDEKPKRQPLEDDPYEEKPKRYYTIFDDGELVEEWSEPPFIGDRD